MNKVRELKIDNTLWATPAKIISLLDFKPEKLIIETENNKTWSSIKVHQVRYENLTIINHNRNHYHVNYAFISKRDAYNLIQNATIIDKKGTL